MFGLWQFCFGFYRFLHMIKLPYASLSCNTITTYNNFVISYAYMVILSCKNHKTSNNYQTISHYEEIYHRFRPDPGLDADYKSITGWKAQSDVYIKQALYRIPLEYFVWNTEP